MLLFSLLGKTKFKAIATKNGKMCVTKMVTRGNENSVSINPLYIANICIQNMSLSQIESFPLSLTSPIVSWSILTWVSTIVSTTQISEELDKTADKTLN